MMGTVIGGLSMAGSLGMASGPVAGGLIYDTFASYALLYIGSWAVGLGAFVIALTFRPLANASKPSKLTVQEAWRHAPR
jgi:MFS family permease